MLRHREKVLAHAEQQLLSRGDTNPAELLALYKKFLKIENHRIRLKHYSGGSGRDVCAQRASLVDIMLRHLLDAAMEQEPGIREKLPPVSLVAIGGYGRGELNPYSDIDIMFLHPDGVRNVDQRLGAVVQKVLYMLWDVGFKVGHSTRSISEACKQANSDMLSKTSLLESRLVTGDEGLFKDFRQAFVKNCVEGSEEQYIADRVENQAERHSKFGRTVYMQEPNVKNGCGGLRDYQNVLWMAFFKHRVQSTAGLVEKKMLNESERRQLDRAYDFLLRIRTELHYLNKRAADVILISQQLQIADKLDYPQKNILRRTEAFMRDYYQHARTIYNVTEVLSERLCLTTPSEKRPRLLGFLRRPKQSKKEYFDGFYSRDDRMYAESSNVLNQDPARMMRLFQHMQQRTLKISPELRQLLRRRIHLVDRTFQYSKNQRETFTAILSRKGAVGPILRAMHEVDFLGRYVPEFGQLTCLVQHEFFHRYTADEHTLVCVEKLDELIDTQDPKLQEYKTLFQKLDDPFVLYLALLLHDTGKASNARHHAEASALFAQKVAARLQLAPERRKALIFLVDHHITLSSTAQRRNVEDPATVAEFASLVRTQSNLDALMLLTLADGRGTGDENWSDWKETLVWQLYRNTAAYLSEGEAFYRRRRIEREDLRAAVHGKLAADYSEEIDGHFEHMPDRYFQAYTIDEVCDHIRLFRKFLLGHIRQNSAVTYAVKWVPVPNKGHTELWFCGWDRSQLLSRIAGSLSVVHLNILSADVFTRGDHLVLDVFRVCNTRFEAVTDEREIGQVEKRLKQALEEEQFDFTPQLEKAMKRRGFHLSEEIDFPTRISVDNDAHPVYTLVDIVTPDRLGLLYNVLRALDTLNLQIALSRITTEKGAAIDSFYVTDKEGRKIQGVENLAKLQQALWAAAAR
jgi:[protein-PII] uridylyltransferase